MTSVELFKFVFQLHGHPMGFPCLSVFPNRSEVTLSKQNKNHSEFSLFRLLWPLRLTQPPKYQLFTFFSSINKCAREKSYNCFAFATELVNFCPHVSRPNYLLSLVLIVVTNRSQARFFFSFLCSR